jgi:FAD-dependent oxidoreductase domain-containing protein 1
MERRAYDVIIVGGGVMGCSVAYHLVSAEPGLGVAVVERDPGYRYASSALSMANIRVQFRLKENIRISQHTLQILQTFAEDMDVDGEQPSVAFRREGNLFLLDADREPAAKESLELQQSLGCDVEWWTPSRIAGRFPLYDTEGFSGGTFGSQDGHLDAHGFLMGYRKKASQRGVRFIRDDAVAVRRRGSVVSGVSLASGVSLTAGAVVNCAGPWAAEFARTAGVELPVVPVKRQVFIIDTAVKPAGPLPLTVLPSGLYFRTEASRMILVGRSMDEDAVGFDFNYDRDRFLNVLWPELAKVVPAFDTLKLVRAWAGLHAMNRLDGHSILGEWPEIRGFYLANGFSGHGLQQAPAVGRYVTELILGRDHALDLGLFTPLRVLEGEPLPEDALARPRLLKGRSDARR